MAEFSVISEKGLKKLKENNYPGRGIIIGLTSDKNYAVQIYWIMGRSENSRNRVFILDDNNFVRTHPYDEKKVKDPSLIIYYPVKHYNNSHIVTNGDQTDTIFDELKKNNTFESALAKREFEPDSPNYTPRISGFIDLNDKEYSYKLSIIKTINHQTNNLVRFFYSYKNYIPGTGHCLTTYIGDGDPLPSYEGEPFMTKIYDNIEDNLNNYWDILNKENIISLLIKFIDIKTGDFKITVKNKFN